MWRRRVKFQPVSKKQQLFSRPRHFKFNYCRAASAITYCDELNGFINCLNPKSVPGIDLILNNTNSKSRNRITLQSSGILVAKYICKYLRSKRGRTVPESNQSIKLLPNITGEVKHAVRGVSLGKDPTGSDWSNLTTTQSKKKERSKASRSQSSSHHITSAACNI